MPQPHITHETYKGLTPDEQAKYGEEVPQIITDLSNEWTDTTKETIEKMFADYKSGNSLIKTILVRGVHYLKPVEAQQSEGETCEQIIERATRDVNLNKFSVYEALQMGLTLGINHTSATYHPQITSLQQEVERLKEAQRRDEARKEQLALALNDCIMSLRYAAYNLNPKAKINKSIIESTGAAETALISARNALQVMLSPINK